MSNKLNGAKIISDAKAKAKKVKQSKKETTTMKTKLKTIAKTVLTFAAGIALTLASLWDTTRFTHTAIRQVKKPKPTKRH